MSRAPHTRASILIAVALAGVLASCSAGPDGGPSERRAKTSQAIINGVPSDASQDFVVLVVHPVGPNAAYECTGTLLAPNLVLTARHCVSNTADQGFSCDSTGLGSAGGAVTTDFAASSLLIFTGTRRTNDISSPQAKGVKIFHDSATNLCNHDLALIGLDTRIAGQIAQIRLDAKPTNGEAITSVGWGVTATTPSPTTRQQRAGVAILNVGPFSDPNGYDVPPGEFNVGESICQGDSGGPALDGTTNAVVGVVSRGGNNNPPDPNNPAATCIASTNYYTQVAAFSDMIRAAYAEAGQDPWLEGGPDPRLGKFGEACSVDTDCQSAHCLTDANGAGTTCTQDCSVNACPSGFDCKASNGAQLCLVHVDPPRTTTKTGCAVARSGDAGTDVGWVWAIAGLATLRRRRR